MKSRVLLSILVIFLILALVGCGVVPQPKILSANIIITDWEQSYYEYSQEWSDYVYIYYEIENTGSVDIDYYKVWFIITCTNGSKYYDWTNGLFVDVGHKYSDYTMTNVAGNRVVSVVITDWELENWGF